MERNLIVAVILSMGVLYLWNFVINPPPERPQTKTPVVEKSPEPAIEKPQELPSFDLESDKGQTPEMLPDLSAKSDKPGDTEALAEESDGGEGEKPATDKEPVAEKPKTELHENIEELVTIDTELFTAVFTSFGAKLKSFVLKNPQYTTAQQGSEERVQVDVVSTSEPANLPYTLLLDQANFKYDPEGAFKVESKDAHSVTFRYDSPQGVVIRKRFSYTESYLFDFDVTVENKADATIGFFPKIRMVSFEDSAQLIKGVFGSMPLNQQIPKAFIDGELWEEEDKEELATASAQKGHMAWTAIDNRYFLLSLLPQDDLRSQVVAKVVARKYQDFSGDEAIQHWLALTHSLEKQSIPAGGEKTLSYRMYVGPKEFSTLKEVGNHLEESVDFWVLGIMAKPMLFIMQYSYKVIPNWGVAIIILTIIVKLLLYPLTRKSFQSMQRMKELKPKIDALKEKLGDNKQEFNQQMMELYRKEGVNPMGGCLPMMLQMPVYIALYKMLQNSVELYNSPFIPGWLDDLVQPDPYYVLPVLLAVLMFVQQKLTPTPDSQQQKMMMYMMPAMMFFFMLVLPSGLVLYILASTLVGIGQQYWISKKADAAKAPASTKA